MSSFMLRTIKKTKIHEAIVEQIEAAIAAGELKIGDKLPSERVLMEEFGVGRPAVREAILTLERNGLLRISNGERAVVSYPTTQKVLEGISSAVRVAVSREQGVRNFQDARKILEVALARHAARHASVEDIEAMRTALAENASAIGDTRRFAVTDVQFHSAIARSTGNPVLAGLYDALSGWLLDQRNVALQGSDVAAAACRFHELIFDAIERRDPDAAERLMEEHMDSVSSAYWAGVDAGKAEPRSQAGGRSDRGFNKE